MSETNEHALLTISQAADALRIAPRTVKRWIRAGLIRNHRLRLPEDMRDGSRFAGGLLPAEYVYLDELLDDLNRSRCPQGRSVAAAEAL